MSDTARAFWTVAPGRGELREETLAAPGPGEVVVETLYSGISRGTESTVFHGRVPPEEYQRMRAPFQAGDFPGPLKYGYASVGRVMHGPDDLRKAMTAEPEVFVQTFTENLMTFALGRPVQYFDMPTVRAIVRDAGKQDYRLSAIVLGIVNSPAFQLEKVPTLNKDGPNEGEPKREATASPNSFRLAPPTRWLQRTEAKPARRSTCPVSASNRIVSLSMVSCGNREALTTSRSCILALLARSTES